MLDTIKAARELEATVGAVNRLGEQAEFNDDPTYVPDAKQLEADFRSLPYAYWSSLTDTNIGSKEEYQWIVDRVKAEMRAQETLGEAGALGTLAHFGAALFDEGAIALALTTSPMAAGALKAGRLKRILAVGGLVGAENASLEALLAKGSQTRDAGDVVIAGLTGMALGGSLGALGRAANTPAPVVPGKAPVRAPTRPPEVEALDRAADDIATRRIERTPDPGTAIETRLVGEPQAAGSTSVGAAEDVRPETPLTSLDIHVSPEEAPHAAMSYMTVGGKKIPLRFDIAGRLGRSNIPLVRKVYATLVAEPVGYADRGKAVPIAAEEIMAQQRTTSLAAYYRTGAPAYKEWAAANGKRAGSLKARREFNQAVTRAVRTGVDHPDPHINKAAQAARKMTRDTLQAAQDARVRGFEDLVPDDAYLPRLIKTGRVVAMSRRFQGGLESLVAGAVRRAQPRLDEVDAGTIAKQYLRAIRQRGYGMDLAHGAVMRRNADEVLREVLDDSGMDPDEIQRLIAKVRLSPEDKGPARSRHRLLLDEDFSMELRDLETGQVREVRIDELYEDDIDQLLGSYARQMSGRIGMAKAAGIYGRKEFDDLIQAVRQNADDNAVQPKELAATVDTMEFVWKGLTGAPLEANPAGIWSKGARLLRDWNYVRIMNQTGWAQLAEIGNVVAYGGTSTILKHLPAMRQMVRNAKTGEMDHELIREMEHISGLGTDWLRGAAYSRHDDLDFGLEETLGKAEPFLHKGKRITTAISGMAGVTSTMQRFSSVLIAQKFTDMAGTFAKAGSLAGLTGRKGERVKARLRVLGLEDSMAERIFAQINKHKTEVPSNFVGGRKVRLLGIESWDDLDARDAFTYAAHRLSRKIVQENDLGASAQWMHSTTGKMLVQFRSFMMVAYTKQLLYGLHMRDFQAFSSFAFSMMAAGTAYTAQTYTKSLGREDAEEYRAKRLTTNEIAKAAFQRAGFASIIPTAIDSVWVSTLGDDPIFAYGRSTDLASSVFRGNPSVDLVNKALGSVGNLAKPAARDDYEFSQENARDLASLMAWSNAMGIQNMLNALTGDLPARSRKEWGGEE